MLSEKELALFTLRNIQNNFLIGGVINAIGDPNLPLIDEDGNEYSTAGGELERQLGVMFSGARNAGSFIVFWSRKEENSLKIAPFESNNNDKKFLEVKNQIQDSICIATGVPPILAGIQVAGKLGDNQEKIGAILFMNHKTLKQRIVKDTILNTLFSKFSGMMLDKEGQEIPYVYEKFETKKIQQYEIIPQYIFEALPSGAKIEHIKKNYDVEISEPLTAIPNVQ
jgi:phage portal protein BeeE